MIDYLKNKSVDQRSSFGVQTKYIDNLLIFLREQPKLRTI